MPLLEPEAVRMASALDDYEYVRVTDIGGTDQSGYWLCVTDQRLEMGYELASHCDYWDFLSCFAVGTQWPVRPFGRGEVA